LHPKFYKPIFLWDVKAVPNYTEKLVLTGIDTITLYYKEPKEVYNTAIMFTLQDTRQSIIQV
jgi:hypothetical protein